MREYEMLTKLMRLLTIKLVKIQYKMRMPGIGEDTMKSVLLCSPPGGGTMGGGIAGPSSRSTDTGLCTQIAGVSHGGAQPPVDRV